MKKKEEGMIRNKKKEKGRCVMKKKERGDEKKE